jgi:hypothetical protein
MKTITTIFLGLSVILFGFTSGKPVHEELGGIKPIKTLTQEFFGKNVGYYIMLKNTSNLKCDAVKWKAYFYDNFGDNVGIRNGQWSSGNIIQPVGHNVVIEDIENVWINGATKIVIVLNRVHFTNGDTYFK